MEQMVTGFIHGELIVTLILISMCCAKYLTKKD